MNEIDGLHFLGTKFTCRFENEKLKKKKKKKQTQLTIFKCRRRCQPSDEFDQLQHKHRHRINKTDGAETKIIFIGFCGQPSFFCRNSNSFRIVWQGNAEWTMLDELEDRPVRLESGMTQWVLSWPVSKEEKEALELPQFTSKQIVR